MTLADDGVLTHHRKHFVVRFNRIERGTGLIEFVGVRQRALHLLEQAQVLDGDRGLISQRQQLALGRIRNRRWGCEARKHKTDWGVADLQRQNQRTADA